MHVHADAQICLLEVEGGKEITYNETCPELPT